MQDNRTYPYGIVNDIDGLKPFWPFLGLYIRDNSFMEIHQIIDLLEIQHIRHKPVGMLPYGLQKRVELGRALALEPARDYKRHLDGGRGPNTGGMGCYSPVTDLPEDLVDHTISAIIEPVLGTLAEDGIQYRGFLYAGLILTEEGPKVLEFNCRLGDPETQVLMVRLDEDLLDRVVELLDEPRAAPAGSEVGADDRLVSPGELLPVPRSPGRGFSAMTSPSSTTQLPVVCQPVKSLPLNSAT